MTDIQGDFLSEPQLSSTFCDLITIDEVLVFNLSHMAILRSLTLESYYAITKNLWQNRKFQTEKYYFLILQICFANTFWSSLTSTKSFPDISAFAENHAFGMVIPRYGPYQIRSSGKHISLSFKVSFRYPVVETNEQLRERCRVPFDGYEGNSKRKNNNLFLNRLTRSFT